MTKGDTKETSTAKNTTGATARQNTTRATSTATANPVQSQIEEDTIDDTTCSPITKINTPLNNYVQKCLKGI